MKEMPAFRKINATILAANKSKKIGNWEKMGKKSAEQNSSFKHQII